MPQLIASKYGIIGPQPKIGRAPKVHIEVQAPGNLNTEPCNLGIAAEPLTVTNPIQELNLQQSTLMKIEQYQKFRCIYIPRGVERMYEGCNPCMVHERQ